MAAEEEGSDLEWTDRDRTVGQLFMMGFDGTKPTPEISSLIQDHHLGSVLLTSRNLTSAEQTVRLVLELQTIAYDAGHSVPLLIALDQENGGVNALYDEEHISQFPGAMGLAATGSPDLAYRVSKATAEELSAVGINWILGPVLEVLTSTRSQPLGVRTAGDDPDEVSVYGAAHVNGYKDAGLVTCGKFFPSYGHLQLPASPMDRPIIAETIDQMSPSALVPFRNAIVQGLDAVMVAGCAMPRMNTARAYLSDQVVNDMLREKLQFRGVVLSDCIEPEAVSQSGGLGRETVMAVKAGCDCITLCRSFPMQLAAMSGLKAGIENGLVSEDRIRESLQRILELKSRCTSWEKALSPSGVIRLSQLRSLHVELSAEAYAKSITVVRDTENLLPLPGIIDQEDELLLLTPLVHPLRAPAATQGLTDLELADDFEPTVWHPHSSATGGESVFCELGRSLARQRVGKVSHTSYTANGVRPFHEHLIDRAGAVILVTASSSRNLYQTGFTKHVSMICKSKVTATGEKAEIPLVVVSVSSPDEFAVESTTGAKPEIGTYVCAYDFTETALKALVKVLYGETVATGSLPGRIGQGHVMA